LIEPVGAKIADDQGSSNPYSSVSVSDLVGRRLFRIPTLPSWGSERWAAMFGSVGFRTHSGSMKSTTGWLLIAGVRTASTGASFPFRCWFVSFLQIRRWERLRGCSVAASAGCSAPGFALSMLVL